LELVVLNGGLKMRKRMWIAILLVVLLLAVGVTIAQAQATNGAIRGTLYNDTNADGVCGAEGDPTVSGVPIEFTHSGGHTITLTSGNDGSYGLASVSLGTWSVAVKPLDGWTTTSLSPIVVTLTETNNTASNINFCLAQVTATQPIAPTPTPVPPTTLPESGASGPPTLLIAAGLGAILLLAGMALIIHERRTTG
jgi:hypothetical protein